MEQSLISIVIPVFNAEAFLPQCLDSVLAQTWKQLEIILVDDGSTDKSAEICQQYQKQDFRVKFVSQENQGVSAARNRGIGYASGRYITFVDADDWIEHDHIAELVSELEQQNADCVICGYWIDYPSSSQCRLLPQMRHLSGAEAQEKMLQPELFQGFLCNKLFRTDLIRTKSISLKQNLTHYEDIVFCAEYFSHSRTVSVTSGTTYHYRQHSSSAMGHRTADKRWLAGRISAVAALEQVSMQCKSDSAKCLCQARKHMEYADILRRTIAAGAIHDSVAVWTRNVRAGIWVVLRSPLKQRYKIKYLITAAFPAITARFWISREDKKLVADTDSASAGIH